jgi:predicted aldo/keto reductase-like oxidoreductase
MEKIHLGKTALKISRLFLGTGTDDFRGGCLQARIPPEQYAVILKKAYEKGINFWDSSDDYRTHRHIRLGMEGIPRENLVISTKTYAATSFEALRVLNRALEELNTPYVDIFFLHSVDSLEGYTRRINEVVPILKKTKQDGKIKAIGLSTHNIHVLDKAVDSPELDVIFTNFNKYEIHMDASLQWYSNALDRAYKNGKGVLVMKTVGEGKLRGERAKESIQFNLSRPFIHGVCVGIVSESDLEIAVLAAMDWKKQ